MATKRMQPKDCTQGEEDDIEDLDVQKILDYHLKEVLDLVSKSNEEQATEEVMWLF